jgi:cell fate regulator YaaT (PSP1 superfamily)
MMALVVTAGVLQRAAPGVDFRAVVRDLGGRLKARVELRQIGRRDETRLQGGIGPCGRDLCCAASPKDFEPVSVPMAKDQDLRSTRCASPGPAAG